jgi:hypothetical protein
VGCRRRTANRATSGHCYVCSGYIPKCSRLDKMAMMPNWNNCWDGHVVSVRAQDHQPVGRPHLCRVITLEANIALDKQHALCEKKKKNRSCSKLFCLQQLLIFFASFLTKRPLFSRSSLGSIQVGILIVPHVSRKLFFFYHACKFNRAIQSPHLSLYTTTKCMSFCSKAENSPGPQICCVMDSVESHSFRLYKRKCKNAKMQNVRARCTNTMPMK